MMYHSYERLAQGTVQVLKVVDAGDRELLDFGHVSGEVARSMLFCDEGTPKRGQVEVIAVPFQEGSHTCTSIGQAIEVVEWLQDMHSKGYVHGDIRAFNLVFSDDGGSVVIDFDFGGRSGEVTYPQGYNTLLEDGSRIDCDGGNDITPERDLISLLYVLTSLHRFDFSGLERSSARSDAKDIRDELEFSTSMEDLLSKLRELESIYPNLKMIPGLQYGMFLKKLERYTRFPKVEAGPSTSPRSVKTSAYGVQGTPKGMRVKNV